MTMKRDAKRTARKKLTLNKETIRDLTPGKKQADSIRAGARRMSSVDDECGPLSTQVICKP